VELIFELSEKGRKGYRLPKLDVPAVDVAQYLGEYYREDLNFPEVSELDRYDITQSSPREITP